MTLLSLSLICTTVPSRAEKLMIKGLWLGALYFPGLESPWRVSSCTDPYAMLPEFFVLFCFVLFVCFSWSEFVSLFSFLGLTV